MFAPAVAWAAPAATGECYLQEATKAAWMESMDREAAYADQLGKVAIKLMAIGKKAKGHGPLGPQISAEDRKTFGELTDQTVVLRMKETLESARRRDIDAVERLAKLAPVDACVRVWRDAFRAAACLRARGGIEPACLPATAARAHCDAAIARRQAKWVLPTNRTSHACSSSRLA
jgi:hypothetical protein